MASAAQAKAVELQLQMRHNAEDLHDFLRDMEAWESDIKSRDAQLRGAQAGGDPASAQNLPPVRNKDLRRKKRKKIDNTASDCIENGVKHGKSEARIKSCDYSAWEKFDVEKAAAEADRESTPECETEEDEDEEVAERKQYEELRAKQQALIEKDKGNEYFKTGDYDAANDCYTRGMEVDPHNALLPANRAMAFLKLKKYELAESDCNLAIQLDPSYPKAFARRGAARLALNKLKEAREDFEAVLTFDPVNKQAIAELEKIKEMIEKTAKSGASQTSVTTPRQDAAGTREGTTPGAAEKEPSNVVQPFTRQPHLRSKKPLRRMTIEEVGSDMQPKMVQSVEGTGLNAEGVHTPPSPPQLPLLPAAQLQPSSAGVRDCGKEEKKVQASVKVADGEEAEATGEAVVGDEEDTRHHGDRRVTGSEQPGVILSVAARDEGRTQQRLPNTQKSMPMTSDLAQTVSVPPPPSNSFQLESDLRQLKGRPNLLYQYIKQIAPIAFPQIMQQPLEPDVLYKLLNVLKESYIPHEDKALIFAVLHNLSLVRRFDMAVMFMSTTEKADVLPDVFPPLAATPMFVSLTGYHPFKRFARALFDHIASAEDISGASVTALKTKYSL